MNKQEAIETIKNIDTLNINDMIAGQKVDMVIKNQVLDIISQIHEPQKPVVPKFVAEWIEEHKKSFPDSSAIDMYENLTLDNSNGYYHEVWLWVIDNNYDFIKAWHEGYEIEPEKLYTVEIPDQNSYVYYRYLSRNDNGICIDASNDAKWKQKKRNQLTESEIKQNL